MVEKTIELTEEQLEKLNTLEANNISVGEAIDMLFKIREDIKANAPTVEDINRLSQLVRSINSDEKQEIVKNEYTDDETYDEKIQDVKRNISWSRDFFKF